MGSNLGRKKRTQASQMGSDKWNAPEGILPAARLSSHARLLQGGLTRVQANPPPDEFRNQELVESEM